MPTKTSARDKPDAPEAKYRAPALEKGLDILELMASHDQALRPSQMADILGRSLSELFRMIQVLEYRGFIALADNKEGYVLTNKLFMLGMSQPPTQSLVHAALPVMNELAETTGQSCHLVVPSGDQIVVIARVESPSDLGFSVRVGYRRSLIDTTSGPVLYSLQPEKVKKEVLDRLHRGGGNRSVETFLSMAEEVRLRGYAKAHSDFVEGVTDLSAPIMGQGAPAAALTIPFVYRKPLLCSIEAAGDSLVAATRRISDNFRGSDGR